MRSSTFRSRSSSPCAGACGASRVCRVGPGSRAASKLACSCRVSETIQPMWHRRNAPMHATSERPDQIPCSSMILHHQIQNLAKTRLISKRSAPKQTHHSAAAPVQTSVLRLLPLLILLLLPQRRSPSTNSYRQNLSQGQVPSIGTAVSAWVGAGAAASISWNLEHIHI